MIYKVGHTGKDIALVTDDPQMLAHSRVSIKIRMAGDVPIITVQANAANGNIWYPYDESGKLFRCMKAATQCFENKRDLKKTRPWALTEVKSVHRDNEFQVRLEMPTVNSMPFPRGYRSEIKRAKTEVKGSPELPLVQIPLLHADNIDFNKIRESVRYLNNLQDIRIEVIDGRLKVSLDII